MSTLEDLRRSALEAWNMSIYSEGYTRRVLDADIAYVQALEAEVSRLHTRLFSSCCPCAICNEAEGRCHNCLGHGPESCPVCNGSDQ